MIALRIKIRGRCSGDWDDVLCLVLAARSSVRFDDGPGTDEAKKRAAAR